MLQLCAGWIHLKFSNRQLTHHSQQCHRQNHTFKESGQRWVAYQKPKYLSNVYCYVPFSKCCCRAHNTTSMILLWSKSWWLLDFSKVYSNQYLWSPPAENEMLTCNKILCSKIKKDMRRQYLPSFCSCAVCLQKPRHDFVILAMENCKSSSRLGVKCSQVR